MNKRALEPMEAHRLFPAVEREGSPSSRSLDKFCPNPAVLRLVTGTLFYGMFAVGEGKTLSTPKNGILQRHESQCV